MKGEGGTLDMRKISELFQFTVGTATALLALATVFTMPKPLGASECITAGEYIGQDCAALGPSCSDCVYSNCGRYAEGDPSCFGLCNSAGLAFCS